MENKPDPMSDCETCRLNYWLSVANSSDEAFKLAKRKRKRLEESN